MNHHDTSTLDMHIDMFLCFPKLGSFGDRITTSSFQPQQKSSSPCPALLLPLPASQVRDRGPRVEGGATTKATFVGGYEGDQSASRLDEGWKNHCESFQS